MHNCRIDKLEADLARARKDRDEDCALVTRQSEELADEITYLEARVVWLKTVSDGPTL